MHVLVTGATGYIGQPLVTALRARGHLVDTPGRHTADLRSTDDARALIAHTRPEVVLHCAWETTPGVYWTSPDNPAWAAATIALADASRTHGVTRFVGVGSCAEYDWAAGDCDEGVTPEHPSSPYGQAKLAACRGTLALGTATFATTWARVFSLFGGREHPARLVPSVVTALMEGRPALCTHGEQVRDFLHVADVVGALVAVAESPVTGVVNVGSGEAHRVRDVIDGLAARLGRHDLIRLGARATTESARVVTRAARLRDEVGWCPRLTFDHALDLVVQERRSGSV